MEIKVVGSILLAHKTDLDQINPLNSVRSPHITLMRLLSEDVICHTRPTSIVYPDQSPQVKLLLPNLLLCILAMPSGRPLWPQYILGDSEKKKKSGSI